MKASAVLLVGFWPIVLLLMLLSVVSAQRDLPVLVKRLVARNNSVEISSDSNNYGIPPPYLTAYPTAGTVSDDGDQATDRITSVFTASSATTTLWNTTTLETQTSNTEATSSFDDPASETSTSLKTGFDSLGTSTYDSTIEGATRLGSPTFTSSESTGTSEITITVTETFSELPSVVSSGIETPSSSQAWNLTTTYTGNSSAAVGISTHSSTGVASSSTVFPRPQSSTGTGLGSTFVPATSSFSAPAGNSTVGRSEPTGSFNTSSASISLSGLSVESTFRKEGLTVPETIATMPTSSTANEWLTWPTSDLDQTSPTSTTVQSTMFNNSAMTRTARLSVTGLSSKPALPDPSIASSSIASSIGGNFSWSWSETVTKTLSPVLTSLLSRSSSGTRHADHTVPSLTISNISVSNSKTPHWPLVSTPSTTSLQSTANSTSQSGHHKVTVVTVTGGTVVTISPGGFGTTPTGTAETGSFTSPNILTESTPIGSSNLTATMSSNSSSFTPFTSDWSTVTLEESTGDASSFTKSSSLPPGVSKTPSPTNVTKTASTWFATTTIDIPASTSGLNNTAAGTSPTTSFAINGTANGANATLPTSTGTGNAQTTPANNSSWSTITDPVWTSVVPTTLSIPLSRNDSIISISISRGTNMPPFPFPTNASLIWQTTTSSTFFGSKTASLDGSSFANSSMSNKEITMPTESATQVTLWPTPPTSISKGHNSTTGPHWTMNATSSSNDSQNRSYTRHHSSPSIDLSVWSTVTLPTPPFPVPPSLDPTWTTIPASLTASLNISDSPLSSSGTMTPPFPMPSNSTMSGSATGTGSPLPLPFPTFRSATTEQGSSAHTPSSAVVSGAGFSNSSVVALSNLMPTSVSKTVTQLFSTWNSSALATLHSSGVSLSDGEITTTTTIVITQSRWLTTPTSFLGSAGNPQTLWNNSTLSSPRPTEAGSESITTSLSTELGAMQTSGVSASTLSIKTSSPIWANSTSGLSGLSGTAGASGSVTPPASSISAVTSMGVAASSTLSAPAGLTSPLPPWASLGSSTADGRRSSLVPSAMRNLTISEQSSHVGAQTTSTGGVASTWIPAITTSTCSYASNSTRLCTSVDITSQLSTVTASPSVTGAAIGQLTTNCTHLQNGTAPARSLTPFVPIPITSACLSSSTASACTTFMWTNTTQGVTLNKSNAHASPTTLNTVTRHNKVSHKKPKYPVPVDMHSAHHGAPEGGDVSTHRQIDAQLLGGAMGGEISPSRIIPRWEHVISKLKGLWRGDDREGETRYSGSV